MRPRCTLPPASSSDVLRCSQKEDSYVNDMSNAVSEGLRSFFSSAVVQSWQKEIEVVCALALAFMPVSRDIPTLGEEYCGILPVFQSTGLPAGSVRRMGGSVLRWLGPYVAVAAQRALRHRQDGEDDSLCCQLAY